MKVLFIGGTGNISSACTKLAVERGIELWHLRRGTDNDPALAGVKLVRCDVRKPGALEEAVKNLSFDCVVDWIAFTPVHIQNDIRAFQTRTRQFIFISSASAYQKPVTDFLITESTPLANPFWQYSRDKIACENLLLEEYRKSGFPAVIVRPSHTYGDMLLPVSIGPGSDSTILDRIRKGKKVVIHGDGTSLWTLTHNTDFAKAFTGLLGASQTIGHAFHITSDEVLTWDQIYEDVGRACGREPEFVHISSEVLARYDKELGPSLLGDKAWSLVFDNSKIKRFVPGFVATTPFRIGVENTVRWLDKNRGNVIDAGQNELMDRMINDWERFTGSL